MKVIFFAALLIGGTFSTFSHNFNIDNINSITASDNVPEIESFIEDKCSRNDAKNTKFSSLMIATSELRTCLETYFNVTKIQQELSDAKRNGTMDEVVLRYCLQYPQIEHCLKNAFAIIKPCLNSTEQDIADKSLELVGNLKKLICFKDGDRVAMFIAHGGMECLELRREQIQECISDCLGTNEEYVTNLQQLLVSTGNHRCESFMKIRLCFYNELIICRQNIPANIVDAGFRIFRTDFSCKVNYKSYYKGKHDTAVRVIVTVVFLLVAFCLCYFLVSI